MKMVLITERGKPVALVPGSIEDQKRPQTPPRQGEGKIEKDKPIFGTAPGREQQMREVEIPDDVAGETNPEEFVRKLKKAVPDLDL